MADNITLDKKELARRELARRELERRGIKADTAVAEEKESFGRTMYREGVAPFVHGLSTAGFGIPKRNADQEVRDVMYPEQNTGIGKTLRVGAEGAGYLIGGAGKVALKAGELLVPRLAAKGVSKVAFGLGKSTALGLGAKATGQVIARQRAKAINDALRGAVEGTVAGATQIMDDADVGKQAAQGVFGGAVGLMAPKLAGITGGITEKGKKISGAIGREFRKFKLRGRIDEQGNPIYIALSPQKKVKVLEERIKDYSSKELEKIKAGKESGLSGIKSEKSGLRKEYADKISLTKEYNEKILREAKDTLKNNISYAEKKLEEESVTGAKEFQKRLPEFYRENGKGYKAVLDDISDSLIEKGEGITYQEVDSILKNIVSDMDDALILEGAPREAIEAFKGKYGIKFIGENLESNAEEIIPFQELVNDIRQINKTLSSGAKSGTNRYTQEDVAVSIFNKNLGEHIKDRVPEFRELQSDYSKVIQAMKASNKIFKPFKGEYEISEASKLLKAFGEGKWKPGQDELLEAIQKGNKFAPGIGEITESIKKQGMELIEARSRVQPMLQNIKDAAKAKLKGLDDELLNKLDDLSKKEDFIKSDYVMQENMIKDATESRLRQLGINKDRIDALLVDKNKLGELLIRLLKGGAYVGTAGYLYSQTSRGLGGQ